MELFLSDIHIGCKHNKSEMLLELLDSMNPEKIFLVGDIFDGYKLRNRINFTKIEIELMEKFWRLSKNGVEIQYITGNHDDFLRRFSPMSLGNIHISNELILDDNILITHGDFFDTISNSMPFLYKIGDKAYSACLNINTIVNKIRKITGYRYLPISKMLKNKVKSAVSHINNFENTLAAYAKEKECNTIICGHIHNPGHKIINNVSYFNCGDWVENCSYLIREEENISVRSFS